MFRFNVVWLLALCVPLTVQAIVLPGTVTTDTTLPSGVHTVSGSTYVAEGVTLTLQPGANLQFVDSDGELIVAGAVDADGASFTGDGVGQRWGRLWFNPGSTCRLASCTLAMGGGSGLPPPPLSNAVVYAADAYVAVSNTTVSSPKGDCFAFLGGMIDFVDNMATAAAPAYGFYKAVFLQPSPLAPTYWHSRDNILDGAPHPGIYIEGVFDKDLILSSASDLLFFSTVSVQSATLQLGPGAVVRFSDSTHLGSLSFDNGAALVCCGTASERITFRDYDPTGIPTANAWNGIKLRDGSTALFDWTTISRASALYLSNVVLVASNSQIIGRADYAIDAYLSDISGFNLLITGFVQNAVTLSQASKAIFRRCIFDDNNPPNRFAIRPNDTSWLDARYCYWGAADGPYPYGAYGNEMVRTNTNPWVFPWLLAPPDSQTNPPTLSITSPAVPVYTTAFAQIVLQGTATDNSGVTRVVYKNLASDVVGTTMPGPGGAWEAQVWLVAGLNQLGVTADDNEGNATVAGVLVYCTGSGVGDGGLAPPSFNPLPDLNVKVGQPLSFRVTATSPTEPAFLSYWAVDLPAGATFDQLERLFEWVPSSEGTYNNIGFFVTDGFNTSSQRMDIVVSADGAIDLLDTALPPAFAGYPYYFMFASDAGDQLLTWDIGPDVLPNGMFMSRAGVIAGVPLDVFNTAVLNFNVQATAPDGSQTQTKQLSLTVYKDDSPPDLRVTTMDMPVYALNDAVSVPFDATNGTPAYAWSDSSGTLSAQGVALSGDGMATGTAQTAGFHPWTAYVEDQSNLSAKADMILPVLDPSQQLTFVPGKNKLTVVVKQKPGKEKNGKVIAKFMLNSPANVNFGPESAVAARVGYAVIDVNRDAFKYKPGVKVLALDKNGTILTKTIVKQLPTGQLKAKFIYKRDDLRLHFQPYGLENETVKGKQVVIPVWVRIADFMTATENVQATDKSVLNKVSKAKAIW